MSLSSTNFLTVTQPLATGPLSLIPYPPSLMVPYELNSTCNP
jgi:hypothetical protein